VSLNDLLGLLIGEDDFIKLFDKGSGPDFRIPQDLEFKSKLLQHPTVPAFVV
jgi:hypothetical protein